MYLVSATPPKPSNSSHLAWRVGLLDIILTGDHPSQAYLNLVLLFLRRRYKMWKFMTDEGRRQVKVKAHVAFYQVSDIAEILLKVALNTKNQSNQINQLLFFRHVHHLILYLMT
jgi:hypothetical protein